MKKTQLPKTIYHYCNCESFLNIIMNKSIWLSSIISMNDYSEVLWTNNIINSVLKELSSQSNKKHIEELILYFKLNNPLPYIASFSEKGDLLSQWRAYTDNGYGIAIGFNHQYFDIERPSPVMGFFRSLTLGLSKIIYNAELQRKSIKFRICEYLIKQIESDQTDSQSLIETAQILRAFSYIFKNPAFKEEAEWRIIHTPIITANKQNETKINGAVSNLIHRISSKKLISYFELSFAEKKEYSPINEIILGPKNRFSKFEIETFLSLNNCKDVKIKNSSATYR